MNSTADKCERQDPRSRVSYGMSLNFTGIGGWSRDVVNSDQIRFGVKPDTCWMKGEALCVPCPICGSRVGQKCELATGQVRTNSHFERQFIGADQPRQPRRKKITNG